MEKIAIVTDSTMVLPKSILENYPIKIVSLNVLEGDTTYKETEIDNDFVFDKFDNKIILTTSQPSPSEFLDAYNEAFADGFDKVLVLPLSEGLSGTYQSAVLAKNMLEAPKKVYVFDTQLASYGNELMMLELCRLFDEKKGFDAIVERMNSVTAKSTLVFTVENLFHLQKGGRLSKAQALIGTALRVKPMIKMTDGKLKLFNKERTMKKLYDFTIKMLKEDPHYAPDKTLHIRFIERNSKDNLETMKEHIDANFEHVDMSIQDMLSPVFSIHIGPKGFGIVWYFD